MVAGHGHVSANAKNHSKSNLTQNQICSETNETAVFNRGNTYFNEMAKDESEYTAGKRKQESNAPCQSGPSGAAAPALIIHYMYFKTRGSGVIFQPTFACPFPQFFLKEKDLEKMSNAGKGRLQPIL